MQDVARIALVVQRLAAPERTSHQCRREALKLNCWQRPDHHGLSEQIKVH
jgi:hypothetical protein